MCRAIVVFLFTICTIYLSAEPLYVGVIGSLTGPLNDEVVGVLSSISLGFWAVNQSNILPSGTKLVPVWKDDQSEDLNSFFCALELCGVQTRDSSYVVQKSEMVIGPIYSAQSQIACPVAQMFSLPLLTTSGIPNLTDCPYFNRIIGNDTAAAGVLAATVQQFGWKSVGIIFVTDDYSTTFANVFQHSCEAIGISIAIKQAFVPRYDTRQLANLKTLDTRIYLVAGYAGDGQRIFEELKSEGMFGEPWVYLVSYSMGINAYQFLPEGSLRLYLDSPKSTPEYAEYAKNWQLATAVDPSIVFNLSISESLPYGYDAVFLAALALAAKTAAIEECIEKAPDRAEACRTIISGPFSFILSLDRLSGERLQEIMRAITFRGVTGEVGLDNIGNRRSPMYGLSNVQKHQFVLVAWAKENGLTQVAPVVWPDGTHRVPSDRSVVVVVFLSPTMLVVVLTLLIIVYILIVVAIIVLVLTSNAKGAHASPRRKVRACFFLVSCTFLNTALVPELFGNIAVAKWLNALAVFTFSSVLYAELRILSSTFQRPSLSSMPYPHRTLLLPLAWSLGLQLLLLMWWTIELEVYGPNSQTTFTAAIAITIIPALWTVMCVWEMWRTRAMPGKYRRSLSITISVCEIATLQVLIWIIDLSDSSFSGLTVLMKTLIRQAIVTMLLATYFIPLINAIKARPPKQVGPGMITGDLALTLKEVEHVYQSSLQDIERVARNLQRETELIGALVKQQVAVGEEVRYMDGRSSSLSLATCCANPPSSPHREARSGSSASHTELDLGALILPDEMKEALLWNKSSAETRLNSNPKRKGSNPARRSKNSGSQAQATSQGNAVPPVHRTRPRSASTSASASIFLGLASNGGGNSSSSDASPKDNKPQPRTRLSVVRAQSHESLGSIKLRTRQLYEARESRNVITQESPRNLLLAPPQSPQSHQSQQSQLQVQTQAGGSSTQLPLSPIPSITTSDTYLYPPESHLHLPEGPVSRPEAYLHHSDLTSPTVNNSDSPHPNDSIVQRNITPNRDGPTQWVRGSNDHTASDTRSPELAVDSRTTLLSEPTITTNQPGGEFASDSSRIVPLTRPTSSLFDLRRVLGSQDGDN